MNSLMLTSSVTFAASLALTAAVRALARRWNIVDRPDGKRKLHRGPIPLLGGVAVYASVVIGLLTVFFGADVNAEFVQLSTAWVIAAGFVCLVGAIDDSFNLPSRVKLGLQILSVLPIVLLGHHVDRIVAFGYPIEFGWLGIPLTVLWLVGCINALNLIDGMDGLASIVGLSTAAMLGVIAASQHQNHVAVMAIVLAASLAGFLTYNLPPASIFLGDSGSMVIGLTLGLVGIQGSMKTSATLAITAPAVVMTLPMFDILAAIVRRRLTGRRFDSPDRLHIHHRLLDRGWTPWQVLCLAGAICLTMGGAATAATIFRRDALAWIAAMTLVVLLIRLRLFGYDEFALVKKTVVGFFVGKPKAPRSADAASWDSFLGELHAWDVQQVEFSSSFDNQRRRIRWIDPAATPADHFHWRLSVSLPDDEGRICELSVAGPDKIRRQEDVASLTSLLKSYGAFFAAHDEQLFGPPMTFETLPTTELRPDGRRKAA